MSGVGKPSRSQIEMTLAVLSWLRGFVDNDTVRAEIDHVAIELAIAEVTS